MAGDDAEKYYIRLHIYDTDIRIRVFRDEEALYRKETELINQLLNAYYASFKGVKSDKEIMYYAMLDLGYRLEKELASNNTKPYEDILGKLTAEIEEALSTAE